MRILPPSILLLALVAGVSLCVIPANARAQLLVANNNEGTIGEYTTSGTVVNASLISDSSYPLSMAVSGSDIFVANGEGTVGEYTTSGSTVNASLITGLNDPWGIAVSGSLIFVTNETNGTIGEYTTSGATVNASLITGLNGPTGIALSGQDIFVATFNNTIGEYTISGGTVNASLVTGLSNTPRNIAISGTDLFVTNGSVVGKYTTSGSTVNASLITGLNDPWGIAVFGSDIFVRNGSGSGTNNTVGEYTTSGATVNASLITGLSGTSAIAVIQGIPDYWNGANTTANGTVNGGAGNWDNVSTNWTTSNGSIASAWQGGNAIFSGGAGTVTLADNISFTGIEFSTTGYVIAASDSYALIPSGSATITTDSGVAATISAPINGSGSIVISGSGTLTFSGANSYTGSTLINGGTLNLGSAGALGGGGNISFGGGTQQYTANNQADYSPYIVSSTAAIKLDLNDQTVTYATALASSNTGGLTVLSSAPGGILMLTASNSYSGTTTVSSGNLVLAGGALNNADGLATATGGTFELGDNAVAVNQTVAGISGAGGHIQGGNSTSGTLTDNTSSGTFLYAGVIGSTTGNGNNIVLMVTGTGAQVFTGANTYTGSTSISSGATLQIGNGSANGKLASSIIGNSGTLILDIPASNTDTYSGFISLTGEVSVQGDGTQIFTGANTYSGTTVIGSLSTLEIGNGGTDGSIADSLKISDAGTLVFDTIGTSNYGGNISGTGAFTQLGSGTTYLIGSNTYTGTTRLTAGVLNVGSANALAGGGSIIFTGGTLQYSSANTTDYSPYIAGSTAAIKLDLNGQAVTYASSLASSNTHGLTLQSSVAGGSLTLNAANAYTGATTVSSGTLIVNGSIATSSGVAISAGTRLAGSGVVGNISGAGMVAPGDPAILTAAQVNPGSGMSFTFNLTQLSPNYASSSSSGNDILHLTGASPLLSAMTSSNVIMINFAGATLSAGQDYLGGIFTDSALASLGDPTIDFINTGGQTIIYEGLVGVASANFDTGTVVNGQEMEFQVATPVPAAPPWALLLTAAGLLVAASRRLKIRLSPPAAAVRPRI